MVICTYWSKSSLKSSVACENLLGTRSNGNLEHPAWVPSVAPPLGLRGQHFSSSFSKRPRNPYKDISAAEEGNRTGILTFQNRVRALEGWKTWLLIRDCIRLGIGMNHIHRIFFNSTSLIYLFSELIKWANMGTYIGCPKILKDVSFEFPTKKTTSMNNLSH